MTQSDTERKSDRMTMFRQTTFFYMRDKYLSKKPTSKKKLKHFKGQKSKERIYDLSIEVLFRVQRYIKVVTVDKIYYNWQKTFLMLKYQKGLIKK